MGVMDNFLVERKLSFVPAWEHEEIDSYIDDDGIKVAYGGTLEVYGYTIIENSFDGITVEGTTIKMGEDNLLKEVKTCFSSFPDCDMNDKLPIHYCVRKWNGQYAEFECGMDLCRNGMIWVGLERGMYFRDIYCAFAYLKDRLGEFEVHTEEPMKSKLSKQ